jgi:CheY-like chemotaxis protein/signal transduction histidine kinase
MKILIVDDNKENLYLLELMIKKLGHEVVIAENGKQALEKLHSDNFKMIISDILMPIMDGYQLCQAVRSERKFKDLLFIFYTATYIEKEDEEFALGLGADLFLRKPLDPNRFIEAIKNLIQETEISQDKPSKSIIKNEKEILKLYNERLIHKLEKKILDLEKESVKRKKLEKNLNERVKELTCLYNASKLSEQSDISMEQFFIKTLKYILPAWQFPNVTCARIIYNGQEFKTENFRETIWKQKVDIKEYGKLVGSLEVNYLKAMPNFDKDPFLKEKRRLIYSIVEIVKRLIERKNNEQKIKESEEKYRKAYDRAEFYKDVFAHDINNILQSILSGIQISQLIVENPEKHDNLKINAQIIKEQVIRGAKLVSNMRKLSQLEEDRQSLKKIEILNVLKNAISIVKKSYEDKNMTFQIDSVDENLFVKANDFLEDVFENLLINAVRHNRSLIIVITVRISKEQKKGINYVKMEFLDNGFGVADSMKEGIFQRGYSKEKGVYRMGLGLSLVRGIIEIYNGKIWVEDRVKGDRSKGSNFVLLIPEVI